MPTFRALKAKHEPVISRALAPGFEQHLLLAAFDNLKTHGPLCFNNFANSLRELVRLVLQRLGPDVDVTMCSWFKPHKTVTGGITRASRARYAIQGGLSDAYVTKVLKIDVQPVVEQLLIAVETLNKHVHIEESTFGAPRTKVLALAEECLEAAAYFVEHIEECRNRVANALVSAVDAHLLELAISETINEIDELATHHWIDEISVSDLNVEKIGPHAILLTSNGSISVGFQYGSDSDVQKDMGVVTGDSFPFRAQLTVQLGRPLGKSATVDHFHVDTRSWYE